MTGTAVQTDCHGFKMGHHPIAIRAQVVELLVECTDEKVLRGGSGLAEEKARKAVELSQGVPELAVWNRVANYRLAHILLRRKDSDARLQEIDHRFRRAAGLDGAQCDALGPLPAIYRLAVLHRLQLTAGRSAARQAEIRKTCEAATRQIRSNIEADPQLQDGAVNMLELAGYFMGENWADLEGRGRLPSFPSHPQNAWVLLSVDPATSTVQMTRKFAESEFTAWHRAKPEAVILRINNHDKDCELACRAGRTVINLSEARLIGLLLLCGSMYKPKLIESVVVSNCDEGAAFRQIKKRLQDKIKALLGRNTFNLIDEGDDEQVRLTNQVDWLGLAHLQTLDPRREICHATVTRRRA